MEPNNPKKKRAPQWHAIWSSCRQVVVKEKSTGAESLFNLFPINSTALPRSVRQSTLLSLSHHLEISFRPRYWALYQFATLLPASFCRHHSSTTATRAREALRAVYFHWISYKDSYPIRPDLSRRMSFGCCIISRVFHSSCSLFAFLILFNDHYNCRHWSPLTKTTQFEWSSMGPWYSLALTGPFYPWLIMHHPAVLARCLMNHLHSGCFLPCT